MIALVSLKAKMNKIITRKIYLIHDSVKKKSHPVLHLKYSQLHDKKNFVLIYFQSKAQVHNKYLHMKLHISPSN